MTTQSTNRPLLSPPTSPVQSRVRFGALLLAVFIAGVHLGLAEQRYKEDSAWVGSVFVAAALVLTICAAIAATGAKFPGGLVRGSWVVNAVVAAGLLALFVLSRTVGLPGFSRSDVPVVQILAMLAELAYVGLAVAAARSLRAAS